MGIESGTLRTATLPGKSQRLAIHHRYDPGIGGEKMFGGLRNFPSPLVVFDQICPGIVVLPGDGAVGARGNEPK